MLNPAPELTRLRQALQIDWQHYNAWLFANQHWVTSIVDFHALECGEVEFWDVVNVLRAEYVTRVLTRTL